MNQKENKISDLILEVARLYNDVDNSDLQAIAETTAKKIIKICEGLE